MPPRQWSESILCVIHLIGLIGARVVRSGTRRVPTLLGFTTTKFQEYDLCLRSVKGNFALNSRVTQMDKRELSMLDNPRYAEGKANCSHLIGVELEDQSLDRRLTVHIILGANEQAQIRTCTQPRVGRRGEPVADFTRFGWALMAPGIETDLSAGYLAVDAVSDYEKLCALDILRLADSPSGDQLEVYNEFREQLTRNPEKGCYETGLPWKGNHPPLPTNKEGSLRRLHTQLSKLHSIGKIGQYDAIIREQLTKGVVEPAPLQARGKEFYMPHRAVIRETAETTKMSVVYDGSAGGAKDAPSLNDCLEPGPALQNKIYDVLVRGRFHLVAFAGDMRQAFLQVRIREGERDALRFHWLRHLHSAKAQVFRFTKALFGLAPSPFLLGGVIEQHLESWSERLLQSVAEILRSLYVDDLISGSPTVTKAKELKCDVVTILSDAAFELLIWHSNVSELEENPGECINDSEGRGHPGSYVSSRESGADQERSSGTLARINDPLGLASPTTLQGKFIYREGCQLKQAWDAPPRDALAARWKRWESELPENIVVTRTFSPNREPINAVELHAFGDEGGRGVSAAVYAVVRQDSGTTQGLVAAKVRLAKQRLTIPRLELVAVHMAVNSVDNIRRVLDGSPVTSVQCWLDSSVALHWIRGNGSTHNSWRIA
ncbi:uncharacterized protein [Acropora muricata]|uniref:uncharacterized protein n=1 Tax=Acropora muricata TaxID=159855 RepID=UPI0034E3EB3C